MKQLILINVLLMSIMFVLVSGGLYPMEPKHGFETLLDYERIIDSQMDSPFVHRILTLYNATVRLLGRFGVSYTFRYILGETFCCKETTPDVVQCPLQYNITKTYTCLTNIYHYLIFDKRYLMRHFCKLNNI